MLALHCLQTTQRKDLCHVSLCHSYSSFPVLEDKSVFQDELVYAYYVPIATFRFLYRLV